MSIATKKPWQGMACGAAGSMLADTVCTPLDVIKVRLQLSKSGMCEEKYSGVSEAVKKIYAKEGGSAFFKGLSPALLRASTYGTARIGLYEPFKRLIAGDVEKKHLPLRHKLAAGLGSGAVASFVFTPCDVVKIRMQSDKTGKRYRGVWHALRSISAAESFSGLYKGASANVGRASICAAVELTTYDETKEHLIDSTLWPYENSIHTHILCSLIAGFASTVASHPVDLVKSRLMNQPHDAAARLYSGPVDCIVKTLKAEGLRGTYAGFWPSYFRIGPHTLVIFITVEQLRTYANWAA